MQNVLVRHFQLEMNNNNNHMVIFTVLYSMLGVSKYYRHWNKDETERRKGNDETYGGG